MEACTYNCAAADAELTAAEAAEVQARDEYMSYWGTLSPTASSLFATEAPMVALFLSPPTTAKGKDDGTPLWFVLVLACVGGVILLVVIFFLGFRRRRRGKLRRPGYNSSRLVEGDIELGDGGLVDMGNPIHASLNAYDRFVAGVRSIHGKEKLADAYLGLRPPVTLHGELGSAQYSVDLKYREKDKLVGQHKGTRATRGGKHKERFDSICTVSLSGSNEAGVVISIADHPTSVVCSGAVTFVEGELGNSLVFEGDVKDPRDESTVATFVLRSRA